MRAIRKDVRIQQPRPTLCIIAILRCMLAYYTIVYPILAQFSDSPLGLAVRGYNDTFNLWIHYFHALKDDMKLSTLLCTLQNVSCNKAQQHLVSKKHTLLKEWIAHTIVRPSLPSFRDRIGYAETKLHTVLGLNETVNGRR